MPLEKTLQEHEMVNDDSRTVWGNAHTVLPSISAYQKRPGFETLPVQSIHDELALPPPSR